MNSGRNCVSPRESVPLLALHDGASPLPIARLAGETDARARVDLVHEIVGVRHTKVTLRHVAYGMRLLCLASWRRLHGMRIRA